MVCIWERQEKRYGKLAFELRLRICGYSGQRAEAYYVQGEIRILAIRGNRSHPKWGNHKKAHWHRQFDAEHVFENGNRIRKI
jgi:hypothetical protein